MSTVVHLLALACAALVYVAVHATPDRPPIVIGMSEAADADDVSPIELSAADTDPQPALDDSALESAATWDAIAPALDSLTPDSLTPNGAVEPLADHAPLATDAPDAFAAFASLDHADVLTTDVLTDAADRSGAAGAARGRAEGSRAGGRHAGGKLAGGGDTAMFFGREGTGRSVCFLCDNSNSHRDGGFHAVLDEVARSVDALRPEQSFFVVFFSDAAYPLFHPHPVDRPQPATPDNKRRLREWLGTVEMCSGGQGIHDAMRLAAAAGTDVVYLLSDGEFSASVVDRVRSADVGPAVVHSLGIQQHVVDRRTGQVLPGRLREQEGFNRNLMAIATAHGGTFTPVVPPPLAAALERLRPIPRNRSRGAVWGLKL